MSKILRIGVLASGGGTNLQAIIDRCQDGSLSAEIAVVTTNNPGAGALDRAGKAGIQTLCINHRDFSQREDFDNAVVKALQEAGNIAKLKKKLINEGGDITKFEDDMSDWKFELSKEGNAKRSDERKVEMERQAALFDKIKDAISKRI